MDTQPEKANTMLVFSRKPREQIVIDGRIKVTILKSCNGTVSVGIEAPREVTVNRGEIETKLRNGDIAKPRNPILRAALVASGVGNPLTPEPVFRD